MTTAVRVPAWLLAVVPLALIVGGIALFAALDAPGLGERREPVEPGRHAPRADARGRATGLHQLFTWNFPIQPSCANSDWCAWNMYWPS